MNLDWRVQVTDNLMTDSVTLIFFRRRPDDRLDVITELRPDGSTVMATLDAGHTPQFAGFSLPREALHAIAEHVKPGPSQAEVKRLEDALGVERGRVDMILQRAAHVLGSAVHS